MLLILAPAGYSSADDSIVHNSFELKLFNDSNDDLTDPLFSNVTYYYDTYTNAQGTIYKMKARFTLNIVPSKLMITSNDGEYSISVKVDGLTSWAGDAGLKIGLNSDDTELNAYLTNNNGFSMTFKDNNNMNARVQPNICYTLSASTIYEDVETTVEPETIENISITFEATLSDGLHQIIYISQGQTIETYKVTDGYVIESVPQPDERTDYLFGGWFTENGREVSPGFTVTSEDGDIISYAKWDYIGVEPSIPIIPIIGIIVGAIIAAIVIAIVIYKRKRYPE